MGRKRDWTDKTDSELYEGWKHSGLTQAAYAAQNGYPAGAVSSAIAHARAALRNAPPPQPLPIGELAEALEELAEAKQRVDELLDPVITFRRFEFNGGVPHAWLCSGCWQTGGRWTNHPFIRNSLEEMLTIKNTHLIQLGDEKENFGTGNFAGRKSQEDQALTERHQEALVKAYLTAVKERVTVGVNSQHGGQWDEKKKGYASLKDYYTDLGIPYFDGMGYCKFVLGDQEYNIAIAHEFKGSSMYNPLHPHKRAMFERFPNADVLMMADRHQYAISEQYVYGNEYRAGNRQSPYVYMLQVGTAKGGPDPYTIRGWENGVSEWPWLVLWPDHHEVRVTRHFEDVKRWLEVRPIKTQRRAA